jgi:hypothetical protein
MDPLKTAEGTGGAPTCSFEKGCSGVDAFAFEWVGEMVYMAPPVSLVSRCIRKIAYEGAHEGEYISSIQMCI